MEILKHNKICKIISEEMLDFSTQLVNDYSSTGSKSKNIAKKKNNFLLSSLTKEVVVYSALMRSLDSSLGNRMETIALKIAEASGYKVSQGVSGKISRETINLISTLLDAYKDKNNPKKVTLDDLLLIQKSSRETEGKSKIHNSDYLLEKEKDGIKHLTLMELKAGGDLDNKKARSEKHAILEQYAILISKYKDEIAIGKVVVYLYFGTVYNKDSLDSGAEDWAQGSVRSFFSNDELLIGKDFWNYICDSEDGWELVKSEYAKSSIHLDKALKQVISSV